jgi:hypothetical protein
MFRFSFVLFALAAFGLAAAAGGPAGNQETARGNKKSGRKTGAAGMEMNTNRMGGDYRDFDLGKAGPAACQAACAAEPECKAWTYVKPGLQGDQARCWLKETAMPPNSDECCVSGVKGEQGSGAGSASPRPRGMERNTNRIGGDYRDFDLVRADPAACQAACAAEAECKAWTYVKPGLQGDQARCWLKDTAMPPNPDECCISGVKSARRSLEP